jgi:hypothetical protein
MSLDTYRQQVKNDPRYVGSVVSSSLRDYFLTPSVSCPSGFNLEARYGAGSFAYRDDALRQVEFWEQHSFNSEICAEIRKRIAAAQSTTAIV